MNNTYMLRTVRVSQSFVPTLTVIAAVLYALLVLPADAATTSTLFPNGQGTYTAWTGDESDIDETGTPDCGTSDGVENISTNTTGDRESVLIDLSSVPNGDTITSVDVTLSYIDGNSGNGGGTFQTFTRLDGTNLDSGVNLAGSGACASGTQTLNVADTVKSGTTTLEVGVLKTATDNSEGPTTQSGSNTA